MLPKYFASILTFYLISPESRDFLGFYCRASIAYNIMLLTFISTPSFSSPFLEENAVGVRNDTFMYARNMNSQVSSFVFVIPLFDGLKMGKVLKSNT